MINVGIVGGTGYTGVELLRLLAQDQQQATPMAITSSGDAGEVVANMFKTRDQAARSTSQKFGFYECAALSHVPVSL
jgi:N-acetyl-gamma-glutamylphosphate reductase